MSCSFRINEHVHIGRSVRKTSGNDTIPYHNIPFKGAKIVHFDNQGFKLSHPNFGKNIWLEFVQLPLTKLTIVDGVIEDELVFVESLIRSGGTQMFLQKTQTLEYCEYLTEHKEKLAATNLIKIKDAKVGHVYKPAACKAGIEHIFLGFFHIANIMYNPSNRGYHSSNYDEIGYTKGIKRAIFLIENDKGKFNCTTYPIGNKHVKELYTTDTKHNDFLDINENLKLLKEIAKSNYDRNNYEFEYPEKIHKASTELTVYSNRSVPEILISIKKFTEEKLFEVVNEKIKNHSGRLIINTHRKHWYN